MDEETEKVQLLKKEYSSLQTAMEMATKNMRKAENAHKEAERCHDKARLDALKSSNGVELVVNESVEEIKAYDHERERKKEQALEALGVPEEEVVQLIESLNLECQTIDGQIGASLEHQRSNKISNEMRKENYKIIRRLTTRGIDTEFAIKLSQNGFTGELVVDDKARTLSINVAHKNRGESPSQRKSKMALADFSGGERSKILACWMLALWSRIQAPFKCMDEWDVYMDERARSTIEEMLYKNAVQNGGQYILISPQGTSLKTFENVKVHEIKKI